PISDAHATSPGPQRPSLFLRTVPATTVLYTLSLHDALPISTDGIEEHVAPVGCHAGMQIATGSAAVCEGMMEPPKLADGAGTQRSEEHTSELQSRENLVCRLLLEKKKQSSRKSVNEHTAAEP